MDALNLHEVEPGRRAAVAQDVIVRSRATWKREHRRPAALTAREALAAVKPEAHLLWYFKNSGHELSESDFSRFTLAMRNIQSICEEVAPGISASARKSWSCESRRPAATSAREAIAEVRDECMVLWTTEANRRAGTKLTDSDSARFTLAMRNIQLFCEAGI